MYENHITNFNKFHEIINYNIYTLQLLIIDSNTAKQLQNFSGT